MSVPGHELRGGCYSKFRIIQKTKRVVLIATHRVEGDLFDITYEERQKIEPEEVRNTEVQEMIESKIVPGLYFWQCRGAIEVNGNFKSVSKLIGQILLFWYPFTVLSSQIGKIGIGETRESV